MSSEDISSELPVARVLWQRRLARKAQTRYVDSLKSLRLPVRPPIDLGHAHSIAGRLQSRRITSPHSGTRASLCVCVTTSARPHEEEHQGRVRQGARRRGWAITCATTNVTRRRATSTAATATPSTASGRWLRRRCDARGVAQTRGVATASATLGATSQRATSTVATATASLERNVLACAPELPALACSLAWAALMAYASARTGQ